MLLLLAKNIHILKCLCPSWFMDIYKPNSAGQAAARGEKSLPSIPCSILVWNSYASHLFLLFESKSVLTCIFLTCFCPQLSLLGLLSNFFYFLSPRLHSMGPTHLWLPSLEGSCHTSTNCTEIQWLTVKKSFGQKNKTYGPQLTYKYLQKGAWKHPTPGWQHTRQKW